ncbi:MAG: adenylate/guanylate cyclase domain-containing protein [Nostoc sp.]|uniref:adenylate/guanylate cyclase domain-containing protein n=1 Tax=Nostoc sp. TaxID=1180 RepID=UPI002FEF4DC0
MDILNFLNEIKDEVNLTVSSNFQIEVIETERVPSFDDSNITYYNPLTKTKKCKRLESCVLYVDMRDSTKISAAKRPATLAKIYSTFVSSMIQASRYFNGHVRNIIGDRVMVVYDKENCFLNAINTAILMNSINQCILKKKIKDFEFRCGIGIDYGNMLVTKAGTIRRGAETEFYRSLVWLGKPANIASKLTDIANKTVLKKSDPLQQGNYYPLTQKWSWVDKSYEEFIDDLSPTFSQNLVHKDEYFSTFIKSSNLYSQTPSPILITQAVYEGLKREHPSEQSIFNNWWNMQSVNVPNYNGNVFGGDIIYKAAEML